MLFEGQVRSEVRAVVEAVRNVHGREQGAEHARAKVVIAPVGDVGQRVVALRVTGRLEDRSALFGVLAQIEGLGLELLEVRQVRNSDG